MENNGYRRVYTPLDTDLYQLTMGQVYFLEGSVNKESVFHQFFRKNPFESGYSLACGLGDFIDFIESYRFEPSDIDTLHKIKGVDGKSIFVDDYLDYLKDLKITCDIDAVPEGTAVFPHEPIVRIKGPIIQCQLIETALLNIINFQTLIATKSSRVCQAAKGAPVMEFGLRRAHGIGGGLFASRASYIGGAIGTSNVRAFEIYGIPVKGTHAHSYVMSHEDETTAFKNYTEAMPNNVVLLVDTYDTLQGVRNAIKVAEALKLQGQQLLGVRLDSGDLAYLSKEARKILDENGCEDVKIIASGDVDEYIVTSLKDQDAKIDSYGVGTKMVTAHDQPSMGGVYKLAAVRNPDEAWRNVMKVSENLLKTSIPGSLGVRRYTNGDGKFSGDMIYNTNVKIENEWTIRDPMMNPKVRKTFKEDCEYHDLLISIYRAGTKIYDNVLDVHQIRDYAQNQLNRLDSSIKRLENPHTYPAGLEVGLDKRRRECIDSIEQREKERQKRKPQKA